MWKRDTGFDEGFDTGFSWARTTATWQELANLASVESEPTLWLEELGFTPFEAFEASRCVVSQIAGKRMSDAEVATFWLDRVRDSRGMYDVEFVFAFAEGAWWHTVERKSTN